MRTISTVKVITLFSSITVLGRMLLSCKILGRVLIHWVEYSYTG